MNRVLRFVDDHDMLLNNLKFLELSFVVDPKRI